MREVAAAARVSIKTVSRVVNGESGVTPKLSQRVAAAEHRRRARRCGEPVLFSSA
jgi:DNA-binding LacI/PurR family transcriptional regulator